ncbi:MAG: DinB family protein [Vibrio litoralis]|uniref:DinB family protein n=1 Tax=Vibrio litoralis TaxID=335972 RepID=UPI003F950C5A
MSTSMAASSDNHNAHHPLVSANIEGIEQALQLLGQLDNAQYIYIATPYVQSSIGAHLRHINDMYFALMSYPQGVIDYDQRRRGALVETQLEVGIDELQAIKHWLLALNEQDLTTPVTIKSETSIYQQQICQMASSLERELLFVSSHTTHHFSVMRVNAEACQIKTNDIFSYAPATASYLRSLC